MLLPPAEAERIVLQHVPLLPSEDCPLAQVHGRILRAPLVADRDLPPFDRVTMDGYALRAAAVQAGRRTFRIAGVQAAGMVPHPLAHDDACIEIMTGAQLPPGADVIVPYEETARDGDQMTLTGESARLVRGTNIHAQASDCARAARLVEPGTRLSGREVAVAASVGAASVTVAMRPSIAIVATGDELIEVDAPLLGAHQIRKSNDYALRAALLAHGLASRVERFHLRDHKPDVEATLRRLIGEFDVILLTGGVSKGKFDFLPEALAKLGVEKKIQGVAQRPGKPFWFGLTPRHHPVFALPGNPVSTYVCFHRYVLPALARMAGADPVRATVGGVSGHVVLSAAVALRQPLSLMLPVTLRAAGGIAAPGLHDAPPLPAAAEGAARAAAWPHDGRRWAQPAPFNTSGDFASLVGTDGFVELPPGPAEFPAGTVAPFYPWA